MEPKNPSSKLPDSSISSESSREEPLTLEQLTERPDFDKIKFLGLKFKDGTTWNVGEPSLTRDQIDRLLGLKPQ